MTAKNGGYEVGMLMWFGVLERAKGWTQIFKIIIKMYETFKE